jgi:transposase
MTHDYKRNRTTTLFAALNSLDGTVIGICQERHRHQERLKFLRVIDAVAPADKELQLMADNYATHKRAKVQRSLKRHPRFHVYLTPTSASWLNMVDASSATSLKEFHLREDSLHSERGKRHLVASRECRKSYSRCRVGQGASIHGIRPYCCNAFRFRKSKYSSMWASRDQSEMKRV